jgi:hypothetical protein
LRNPDAAARGLRKRAQSRLRPCSAPCSALLFWPAPRSMLPQRGEALVRKSHAQTKRCRVESCTGWPRYRLVLAFCRPRLQGFTGKSLWGAPGVHPLAETRRLGTCCFCCRIVKVDRTRKGPRAGIYGSRKWLIPPRGIDLDAEDGSARHGAGERLRAHAAQPGSQDKAAGEIAGRSATSVRCFCLAFRECSCITKSSACPRRNRSD